MSYVTNIIVSTLLDEEEEAEFESFLNELVTKGGPWMHVKSCDVGGSKCLESDLYIAAFNYLDENQFKEHIRSIKSRNIIDEHTIENLQIFVKTQHSSIWEIYGFDQLDIISL